MASELEAVHRRHRDVDQSQAERVPRLVRLPERCKPCRAAVDRHRMRAARVQHVHDDAPNRRAVVDDEHAESRERRGRRWKRQGVALQADARREVKRASLADGAVEPDSPAHHLHEL